MVKLETKEKIRSIEREEVNKYLRRQWEKIDLEFDEDDYWYEVPDEINVAETSLADIIRYEKNRLMNLVRKSNHYYLRGEGWENVQYCECSADCWEECDCDKEQRCRRLKYAKRKREEFFDVNRRLMVLDSLAGRLQGLGESSDWWNKLDVRMLERDDGYYPALRKKIAQETGRFVPRDPEDTEEGGKAER